MNTAVLRALLPRLDGRSRLGLAGELLYLWLNLMAAATLVSVAARALTSPVDPGEIAVIWLFAAMVLRAPAVVAAWFETRPRPAKVEAPSLPAAPRARPRPGAVDGFAAAPKPSTGGMLGTRRAGHRDRLVGRR